jgi:hypothetical protein
METTTTPLSVAQLEEALKSHLTCLHNRILEQQTVKYCSISVEVHGNNIVRNYDAKVWANSEMGFSCSKNGPSEAVKMHEDRLAGWDGEKIRKRITSLTEEVSRLTQQAEEFEATKGGAL